MNKSHTFSYCTIFNFFLNASFVTAHLSSASPSQQLFPSLTSLTSLVSPASRSHLDLVHLQSASVCRSQIHTRLLPDCPLMCTAFWCLAPVPEPACLPVPDLSLSLSSDPLILGNQTCCLSPSTVFYLASL